MKGRLITAVAEKRITVYNNPKKNFTTPAKCIVLRSVWNRNIVIQFFTFVFQILPASFPIRDIKF